MKTTIGMTTLALCSVLAGCSEPAPAPAAAPAPPSQAAAPLTPENQGVLTDLQREGVNAANEVSDVLQQAEEARRKQMEAQGL